VRTRENGQLAVRSSQLAVWFAVAESAVLVGSRGVRSSGWQSVVRRSWQFHCGRPRTPRLPTRLPTCRLRTRLRTANCRLQTGGRARSIPQASEQIPIPAEATAVPPPENVEFAGETTLAGRAYLLLQRKSVRSAAWFLAIRWKASSGGFGR